MNATIETGSYKATNDCTLMGRCSGFAVTKGAIVAVTDDADLDGFVSVELGPFNHCEVEAADVLENFELLD